MSNEIDQEAPTTVLVDSKEEAIKIHEIFNDSLYYHKDKLMSMVKTGFGWPVDEEITEEGAKEVFESHFKWCRKTLLDRINRFMLQTCNKFH